MASVENGDRSSVVKDVVVGGSVMVIASSAISEMWCDIWNISRPLTFKTNVSYLCLLKCAF